jgi:hypothetical protein
MELPEMPFPPILAAYIEKSPRAAGIASARLAAEDTVLIFILARSLVGGSRSE